MSLFIYNSGRYSFFLQTSPKIYASAQYVFPIEIWFTSYQAYMFIFMYSYKHYNSNAMYMYV